MEAVFDRAWHERALRGDAVAVQQLCDAAIGPLFRFALYRVGGDRDLCEEVVSQTSNGLINAFGLGGSFPGSPNGSTVFPQDLKVDYLRVYIPNPTAPTPPAGAMSSTCGSITLRAIRMRTSQRRSRSGSSRAPPGANGIMGGPRSRSLNTLKN